VQLRFATPLTGEQYVTEQAWLKASLTCCPLHPQGGCGFARHGTYARLSPPGTLIARWYCPLGRRTFSLLPDCLTVRLPGTLNDLEQVVVAVEQASSLAASVDQLREDIELPGAMRWVRRRVKAVHTTLHRLRGLLPEPLAAMAPTVAGFREGLGLPRVLGPMREMADPWLSVLPPPFGFAPPPGHGGGAQSPPQQSMGPDPPAPLP
jgi:hypothetical protein